MKKAALLLAVLGSIFFTACDKQQSETESTVETTAPNGETVEVTTDSEVTTSPQ